jgi:hypothetical protein
MGGDFGMIDILKFWRKPTPAERLQSIVDATARSHEVSEYRIRRAAALKGLDRKRRASHG